MRIKSTISYERSLTLSQILFLIGFFRGIDQDSHEACQRDFLLLIQAMPKAPAPDVDVFMLLFFPYFGLWRQSTEEYLWLSMPNMRCRFAHKVI